jgi:hypothetical protein
LQPVNLLLLLPSRQGWHFAHDLMQEEGRVISVLAIASMPLLSSEE